MDGQASWRRASWPGFVTLFPSGAMTGTRGRTPASWPAGCGGETEVLRRANAREASLSLAGVLEGEHRHVAGLIDRPVRDGCREALFGEVYEAPQPVVHSKFTKALAAYLRDGAVRSRSEPKPATTARSQDGASSR